MNLRYPVGWKSAHLGVFTDRFFVRRDVNAIDFVVGDIAVEPLNLRSHFGQHTAGLLRNRSQSFWRELPGAGEFTPETLRAISQKSCGVLTEMGPQIQWLHSYVTDDKVYCVYIAPDEA